MVTDREHTGSARIENDVNLAPERRAYWLAELWRTAALVVRTAHHHT